MNCAETNSASHRDKGYPPHPCNISLLQLSRTGTEVTKLKGRGPKKPLNILRAGGYYAMLEEVKSAHIKTNQ